MTQPIPRTTKQELTLRDLASATRQTPRTVHSIVTQFERYTGIEIERVKQGRAMILRFTPAQFQFLRRAVEFVREDQGNYLDFFKLHITTQHHARLSEAEPFILTTHDWQTFLNRVEGIEQQLTAVSAQLERVLSVLPEQRRTRKKKVPPTVLTVSAPTDPADSVESAQLEFVQRILPEKRPTKKTRLPRTVPASAASPGAVDRELELALGREVQPVESTEVLP